MNIVVVDDRPLQLRALVSAIQQVEPDAQVMPFSSAEELDAFCHPAVIALREHDRTHAVQLLPTLSAFLKNDRDVLATAAVLYVHRNTLAYRIKRILELCPLDLDDFNVRHRLLESILVLEHYDGIAANLKG